MGLVFAALVAAGACAAAAWWMPVRVRATGAGVVDDLSDELASATGDEQRMVAANEVLSDLEHALTPDLKLPVKLAWIAFLSCVALAIAAQLMSSWQVLALCLGAGAVGPALCLWARRAADAAAKEARERVDDQVEALVGELYHAEIVLPKRREMRWKRRNRAR
jgi:Flp pilus assembly protein TadB